jgi:hypothetical protein
MSEPRILLWDIETGYDLVTVFGLYGNKYIPHYALQQERYMICAAWKILGQKKVDSVSILDNKKRFSASPVDDYHVTKTLHDLLSGVDAVVAHNGDNFDMKFFNGRALYHGLGPLPPVTQIDTLKIAKRFFKLNSNRLDYIGKYLGVGQKTTTDQSLWLRCLNGEEKAVKTMVRYNRNDVLLLEAVYKRLAPYDDKGVNFNLFVDPDDPVCPKCGSHHLQKRGIKRALTRAYHQYQCQSCRGWSRAVTCDKTYTSKMR